MYFNGLTNNSTGDSSVQSVASAAFRASAACIKSWFISHTFDAPNSSISRSAQRVRPPPHLPPHLCTLDQATTCSVSRDPVPEALRHSNGSVLPYVVSVGHGPRAGSSNVALVTVPALPPLPPRSATEIVDGAVQLIRPHFGYFLRIAAIGAIPSLIVTVVTLIVAPGTTTTTDPTQALRQLQQQAPQTLLAWVFGTAQSGAILAGAIAVLRGDVLPSVPAAFLSAFRRVFALIGSSLLLILVLMVTALPVVLAVAFVAAMSGIGASATGGLRGGGTATVIVVAVLAIVMLLILLFVGVSIVARSAVMTALIIVEKLGPIEALRRSHALSRGSYLQLAKTYGLVMVIAGVVYGVLASIAAAFQDQQQIAAALLSVLVIPVVPIIGGITLLTYADLRVRREGADLDAALDALPGASIPST
jgi:hypothetical protein